MDPLGPFPYAPNVGGLYALLSAGRSYVNATSGALVALSANNRPAAAIALSDLDGDGNHTGQYFGTVPSGTPAGAYAVEVCRQLGASAAAGDATVGNGTYAVAAEPSPTPTPTSTPGAPLSTAQLLAAVEGAISAVLAGGVSSYTLNGRAVTKLDLPMLLQQRERLISSLARETSGSFGVATFRGVRR